MTHFIMPERKQNSNKGTFGKVLNVAGSENYIGAAYLSTLGALKSGAGYVALASCEKVSESVSILLQEAVLITRKHALKNINNYTVLLIGCGLGTNKKYVNDFINFIKNNKKDMPTIIDADGLNILSKCTFKNLPQNTIITPHPAEAGRLLNVDTDEILSDLTGYAKKLTEKYNCVTVLKSHRTVVCSQTGEIYVNEYGNSALAKAGTGDVLAGIIAGLIAQKNDVFEMAKLGVYLHSRAGEIASKELTEYSVLASDILKYLPKAIKEIL